MFQLTLLLDLWQMFVYLFSDTCIYRVQLDRYNLPQIFGIMYYEILHKQLNYITQIVDLQFQ